MHVTDRRRLQSLIVELPRWQAPQSRRDLLLDLAWGLAAAAPEELPETGEGAADLLLALAESAGATGAGTGLAGLIEDLYELGGDPATLAELAEGLQAGETPPGWTGAPYPGMRPLEETQARIFFGRRAETWGLLRRLCDPSGPGLLLLCGVSGCGKSSLLRAGAKARMAAGGLPRVPRAERWPFCIVSPAGRAGDPFLALTHALAGEPGIPPMDPASEAAQLKAYGIEALADLVERVLLGRPPECRWVLAVDPLEELFLAVDPDLGEEFLDLLVEAPRLPRLRVLAVLRADLLERCCRNPALARALNAGGIFLLAPPERPALARMVTGPSSALRPERSVAIEPALADRLIQDAARRPNGLALMADALKDLYDGSKPEGAVTLAAYLAGDEQGPGLVAGRAERALRRLGEGAGPALDELFARLVAVAPDGTVSRLHAPYRALARDPDMARLLEGLAGEDTRLLTIGEGMHATVALAHEALLEEWPRLRRWIAERREAEQMGLQAEVHARSWAALGYPADLRWRYELLTPARALLADAGLLGRLEREPAVADFLTPEPDWLLAELLCSRTDALGREEIGLRLARIGDPRPGLGAPEGTPAIRWCEIPAGQVTVEGHGVFPVAPFRIAAYPVTRRQLKAFVAAEDGFANPAWWESLHQGPPPGAPRLRHPNYPATYCSWFDAMAFCRWLSARLGYGVRLPDEWEWQWAAQSARSGFVYPWGRTWREDHANTDECGVGRVTAVGMHPAGRSLQGVYDLAGNTWEWCRNRYDDPRLTAPDTASRRVLRGGSWRVNMGFARADFRLDGLPDERMCGSGFRLVAATGQGSG